MMRERVGGLRGPMRPRVVAAGLAGAAWLMMSFAMPPAFAQSTCGNNSLECLENIIGSTLPQDSTVCSDATRQASCFYDLELGILQVFASGQGTRANAIVRANDMYMIIGPPNGTPVNFAVEFEVTGNVSISLCGGDGGLSAAFSGVPGAPSASAAYSCNESCVCFGAPSLNTVLSLPLTRNAGSSFPLGYILTAHGRFAGPSIHGQFRFTGLPAGTTVISCQGYRQDAPVPVQRTSWGTLKVHYR